MVLWLVGQASRVCVCVYAELYYCTRSVHGLLSPSNILRSFLALLKYRDRLHSGLKIMKEAKMKGEIKRDWLLLLFGGISKHALKLNYC